MKLCTAVIAAALLLAADAPARADEDCDTVVKALEDVQIGGHEDPRPDHGRDQEGDE
jgi:ABC-type proline/glycine betaine transport system substrate-binding protein